MSEKLLPCPFCGGTNLSPEGDDKVVAITCLDCGAYGPNEYAGSQTWNRRTPHRPSQDGPSSTSYDDSGYAKEPNTKGK